MKRENHQSIHHIQACQVPQFKTKGQWEWVEEVDGDDQVRDVADSSLRQDLNEHVLVSDVPAKIQECNEGSK